MVLNQLPMKPLTMEEWINSGYAPTLTIIEAAQALYRNHSVKETSRTDAGAENFSETTDVISRIIDECKMQEEKEKSHLFCYWSSMSRKDSRGIEYCQ